MSTSDPQQQQMIGEAMKSIAERRPGRTKLVYDKTRRTIVAVAEGTQAPRALNITADDADMFAALTLSTAWLRDHWDNLVRDGYAPLSLSSWDDGDALTHAALGVIPAASSAAACITLDPAFQLPQGTAIAIVLQPDGGEKPDAATFACPDGTTYRATAWRQNGDTRLPLDVCFADVQPELTTRRSGILETTVLKDKTVVVIGLGTGGAHAAIELAKCGVGNFILIDRDRLSVGNVVRHPGGISQVGRYKVNVIRDLILEKNPDANVSAHPVAVDYDNQGDIKELIAYSDQPVAIEPGLSLDVLPIANMVAKLALLELLADRDSSLNILKRDFAAPWYLWLNRPEPGTEYASWPPLSESMDEMTIHRWYGIDLPRDEECSVCGNFLAALAENYGLNVDSLPDLPVSTGKDR